MRSFKRQSMFLILILLLTGCAGVEKDKKSSNTKITIEPYNMSEKESLLISKLGMGLIESFKPNGTLGEDDDFQISVEVYERGKFKEELLKTWNDSEKNKDSLISFGISDLNDEGRPMKLISVISSGMASTGYPNNITFSAFSNLVGEKVIF